MVSVIMITYGHQEYIRQAIEGVLNQQCNFPVELIIANDSSPDATDDIVRDVIASHPNGSWVKYTRHHTNIGMQPNYVWAVNQAAGEYIAYCEGDDFWTAPHKLQKQIDFLEAHPDFQLCFHQVLELRDGVETLATMTGSEDSDFELRDLAVRNFIHTPSLVHRRLQEALPGWLNTAPACDYPTSMIAARNGRIRYMSEPMAVYRIHNSGVWSTQSRLRVLEKWKQTLKLVQKLDFPQEIQDILAQQELRTTTELLTILQRDNEPEFLKQLATEAAADPKLAMEWLLVQYPAQLKGIRESRSFKLGSAITRVGARLLGWSRRSTATGS